jgi:fumarate hydratase, class II
MTLREEKDSMGTVRVPENAYYGAQTQRAADNFPVSGLRLPPALLHALARIKKCAAEVNAGLGLLEKKESNAIAKAAEEALEGKFDDQFIVDVFQTGSGTSTNMNMNEVLASRANEILTGKRGGKHPVHPNDHVNKCQSSNDVIPSAIHIAALTLTHGRLIPSLEKLKNRLSDKSREFADVKKIGRTHLQDAVPMTLGQEFSGHARQIELGVDRTRDLDRRLGELALGGTAVGNGLNAHPDFASQTIGLISRETGLPFREAENHFAAQAAQDAAVEASGALKTIGVSLIKIANDIRWMASGPRCGFGEIHIPSLQPGSSIMPGKINPVIPESVLQAAAQVMGNDAAIVMGAQSGYFELNTALPLIAHNLLQSISLLSAASGVLAEKCVAGISANREKCLSGVEKSLSLSAALIPLIGYDRAAEIAGKAHRENKTIRQVALEEGAVSRSDLDRLLGD